MIRYRLAELTDGHEPRSRPPVNALAIAVQTRYVENLERVRVIPVATSKRRSVTLPGDLKEATTLCDAGPVDF